MVGCRGKRLTFRLTLGRVPDSKGWVDHAALSQLSKDDLISLLLAQEARIAELERRLKRHVHSFAASLEFDLGRRELAMTDCWVNIMPRQVVHGLHLHPLSTISGTYYVKTPKGASGLKFEDPRLDRFMAAPRRHVHAKRESQPWVTFPAAAGQLLLFESWLRHEVVPNSVNAERISVSFNYNWF